MAIRSTDKGASWEDAQRLSYSRAAMDSRIVSGDAGTFVVWNDTRHSDSINTEIYLKASFDDGATWEPEERVTFAVGASAAPYIVLDGNMIYLFWIDTRDGTGSYEVYFQKGEVSITGINEENNTLPDKISLSAYPNPFNSSVSISYSLEDEKGGKLDIYNIQGQKMRTYNLTGKEGRIRWDAQDADGNKISSGIYFARASASQESHTIKLIYLK